MAEEVYVVRVGGNKAYITKSYQEAVELFLGASEDEDIQVIRATPADIIRSVPEGRMEESALWKSAYKHDWEADEDLLEEVKSMEEMEEIEMEVKEKGPEEEFEEEPKKEVEEEGPEEEFEEEPEGGFEEALEEEEMGLEEGFEEEVEEEELGFEEEIDYQDLADQNVLDIKEKAKELDLDYQKLLEVEKEKKDRDSLKEWLKNQMEEPEKEEEEMEEVASLPEGRLPNKEGIQGGLWLYAEPAGTDLEDLESYPTKGSEMITMADTDGEITEEDVEDFKERKADQIEQAREEEMIPVIVKSFDDSIALEKA